MILLPAIDIQAGRCVRLYQGDFATAHQVAADPMDAARRFRAAGAEWVHMVDLDGARQGRPVNQEIFLTVARESGLRVELGGGIRDMEAIDFYLRNGVQRVILGTAAIRSPELARQAAARYGRRIGVGIDAKEGRVMVEGWQSEGGRDYLELAAEMADLGIGCLVFTDISRDGALTGPNLAALGALLARVSCPVIASGGVRDLADIRALIGLGTQGAICGKSLYAGTLDLGAALELAAASDGVGTAGVEAGTEARMAGYSAADASADAAAGDGAVATGDVSDGGGVEAAPELAEYFAKAPLIPAIVVEDQTGEVLMLAYMNQESLAKTLATGYTWFYSRSRACLWNKGATSGHYQKVKSVTGDCDKDTLLLRVDQTGPACHTGSHSCFFRPLYVGNGLE